MAMPDTSQARVLLERWKDGDEDAARELFQLYEDRLLNLARQRISQRFGGRLDPEDVVQSVFRTFFKRTRDGKFHIEKSDDLWKLLARITVHKTFRQIAFHQAAKRNVNLEKCQGGDPQDHVLTLLDRGPTPQMANQFVDQVEHFLKQLRPEHRQILELRMQGYKDVEIAQKVNVSDRTIRRVMEQVRSLAEQEGLALES
jgi:RNA polymerase sigma-70 factor (ECF subfamily)